MRTSSQTLARMRFDLRWQSDDVTHTDTRIAPQIDLWRDRFPPELDGAVMNQPVGHCAGHRFEPGTLVPPARDELRLDLTAVQFNRRLARGGSIEPRLGRFYPSGVLTGVPGITPSDRRPFRLVEAQEGRFTADLNHPLAERALNLTIRIEAIEQRGEQRGGRCNEVHELVTAQGPGMQARWRGRPTDFWRDDAFSRLDPRPDGHFYASPRLVDHLDRTAIAELTALYGRLIKPGSRILDLMGSWHSHLDPALVPASLTGLGMNQSELEANRMLTGSVVHDLNRDPLLPFPDAAFDAVVCTVSVEYLIRPHGVFAEVARVLDLGGRFIVTFSNRWFPPKAIRIWPELHEFERLGLVLEYFRHSGRFRQLETWSLKGLPRPPDDKYADRITESDPIYAVWGTRGV
nr:methyltransferase domain-containing protein [Thiocapsa sp.]